MPTLTARNTRLDLWALGLLVVAAFLGLALVTYDPADPIVPLVYPLNRLFPVDILSYPLNETVQNACGPWGALVASILLRGLGWGAHYAVLSLGVLAALMLLRRDIKSPMLRTLGWVLSLVGFSTMVAMVLPHASSGSVWGAGGSLGALFSTIFKVHFAQIGGFLLAVSMFVGGLLLCTDYVLIHAGLVLASLTMAGFMGIRGESSSSAKQEKLRRQMRRKDDDDEVLEDDHEAIEKGAAADEAEGDDAEETDEVVSIRVRGKGFTRVDAVDADDDSLDQASEESLAENEDWEDELAEDDPEGEEVGEFAEDDDSTHDDRNLSLASSADSHSAAMAGPMGVRRDRRRLAALRVRRPPEPEDRDAVMHQLDEAAEREDQNDYDLPSIELLTKSDDFSYDKQATEVRQKAKILEKTFTSFGYNVKVVEIETGPVIAQYEVQLESGLRLSKITGLADDLAIALRVPSVRIVAPIPGKNTVGIEVPNDERQLVRLREVMEESLPKTKKMRIPIFLGKDVSGNPLTVDLATMPHLLIAGRTGTGKSVCLNAIISSILMTRKPDEVRMLMIDPKMVELSGYKSLPHLMHPVVTDMRKAEAILAWAVDKMEERYALLAQAGVRHLAGYNQLGREELLNRIQPESDEIAAAIPTHMPYIVIVADEIADMMMTAGKEVEQHIIRLAQKSRAVGIHLILATQKPTVDVITGLIKSNLPARVAFQVASRVDSRVVLDEMGADRLLGNGDMLFLYPGTSQLLRGQGTYVSDEEINAVVAAVSTGEQDFVTELVQMELPDPESAHSPASLKKRDELYEKAIEIVVTEGRGSVSLLQRALGIGYGRAARLIDFMAEDGIVGTYAGSQAREVLMSMADIRRLQQGEAAATGKQPKSPKTIRLTSNASVAKLGGRKPLVSDDRQDEWGEAESDSDNEDASTMSVTRDETGEGDKLDKETESHERYAARGHENEEDEDFGEQEIDDEDCELAEDEGDYDEEDNEEEEGDEEQDEEQDADEEEYEDEEYDDADYEMADDDDAEYEDAEFEQAEFDEDDQIDEREDSADDEAAYDDEEYEYEYEYVEVDDEEAAMIQEPAADQRDKLAELDVVPMPLQRKRRGKRRLSSIE